MIKNYMGNLHNGVGAVEVVGFLVVVGRVKTVVVTDVVVTTGV